MHTKRTTRSTFSSLDLVENGVIEMVFVPTTEMIADGLTKAVGTEKFKRFIQALNMAN